MKNLKMDKMNTADIREAIRTIPDFPKEGIQFKDITPVLKSPGAFRHIINTLTAVIKAKPVDYVIGIESRGFILSPVVAYHLGVGFVPVRKKGKLPYETEEVAYDLEYGQAVLEIHRDALQNGARVAIIDDLLATGGTALAAARLVEKLGARVEKVAFLVELEFLRGRKKLSDYDVYSMIQY